MGRWQEHLEEEGEVGSKGLVGGLPQAGGRGGDVLREEEARGGQAGGWLVRLYMERKTVLGIGKGSINSNETEEPKKKKIRNIVNFAF